MGTSQVFPALPIDDPAVALTSPATTRPAAARSWSRLRDRSLGLLVPGLGVLLWELAARCGWLDPALFTSPADVLGYLIDAAASGGLWPHLWVTVKRVIAGFALGTVTATIAAIITGSWVLPRRLFDPLLQSIRSIPSLAWVPLFILWLGIGEVPKVALIALGSFFPVYLALGDGIRTVDRKLIEVGLAHRKTGWRLIRAIYLPATFPAYHVGLRAGLGLGWMFVVAAEIMGASRGVGYLLVDGQATGRPALMLASIILFALLGKLSDSLLVAAGARWLRWQDTREGAA